MTPVDFFNSISDWAIANWDKIVFSVVTIIVGYIVIKLVSREIKSLRTQNRMEQHAAYILNRILKWVTLLAVFSIVLAQFGITLEIKTNLSRFRLGKTSVYWLQLKCWSCVDLRMA